MPFFLRIIRRARWFTPPWLPAGELQADGLLDLTTKANVLSVYRIDDGHSNLDRVITGLAAARDDPVNFDYALTDVAAVAAAGIHERQSQGDTPDETVNTTWHHDLYELTLGQVVALAGLIAGSVRTRVPHKRVVGLLRAGLEARRLDAARMKESLLAKINAP